MKRRSLLTSVATTALLGVSTTGCLQPLDQSTEATSSGCAPGYRELAQSFPSSIAEEASNGLTLNLSPDTVTPPEPVTATLKNTADSPTEIYDTDRLAIQWLNSKNDWATVLGVAEDYSWNNATTSLEAGDTREWQFRLKRSGFPEPYERCTSFVPGRYRFVYWGRPNDQAPLAIPFEITDT
ncbi:hypothetical protein [Haloferax volcanii]|uniref:Intracellular proteinase inhibitor BsuPI domain-containing protein n=1 Tax=Haloferax volcanii TaxID=2246 RepID=A0A847TQU3_HALVO|nr:hypothetical protein [Haloferax alexandrinus]NLV02907.1 hypothetical protein [Haloferax alexandrinus]